MLDDLIESLAGQVYDVVAVANNWERDARPWTLETGRYPVQVMDGGDGRNISRWWNQGLDLVARHAGWLGDTEWNALVVNDDVVCPPNLVATLSGAMRATPAVLAYPDQCGGRQQILHTRAEPVDLRQRITGYAFMLRGEAGLRADESLVWHYGDDDLDWVARERGGALLVPGVPVEHKRPNGYTDAVPELAAQAARDRETFRTKWGRTPW